MAGSDLSLLQLVRRKWFASLFFSLLILGAYFSFILILALRKDLLARACGALPIGMAAGVGLIVFAWLLTIRKRSFRA